MKDADADAATTTAAAADDGEVEVVHKQWPGPTPAGTKRKVTCRYVVSALPRGVTKAERRGKARKVDEILASLKSGKQHAEVQEARDEKVAGLGGLPPACLAAANRGVRLRKAASASEGGDATQ